MQHPEPAARLEEVRLSLGSGATRVEVLRRVDLEIAAATTTAIVGPSGSGKSTLLMVLGGLERPEAGRVIVAGTDLAGLDEDARARFRGRSVGIVFQSFHLIATMTALENVAVPLELAGRRDAFDVAAEELAAVGLAHRLDHLPGQMSGGEQQRVAVARALAPQPTLVLADEPTGNLDEATGREVADLMFSEAARRRTTLVVVTHDMALAARCGRIVQMRGGRIEQRTPAAALA